MKYADEMNICKQLSQYTVLYHGWLSINLSLGVLPTTVSLWLATDLQSTVAHQFVDAVCNWHQISVGCVELVVIANCFALCDVSYGLVLQGISQWLNEATEDMETLSDGLLQKEVQRMQDELMIESTYIAS